MNLRDLRLVCKEWNECIQKSNTRIWKNSVEAHVPEEIINAYQTEKITSAPFHVALQYSQINTLVWFSLLKDIPKVHHRKKHENYEKFLKCTYNGALYGQSGPLNIITFMHTANILMMTLNYCTKHFCMKKQPHVRTNVSRWIAYSVLEWWKLALEKKERFVKWIYFCPHLINCCVQLHIKSISLIYQSRTSEAKDNNQKHNREFCKLCARVIILCEDVLGPLDGGVTQGPDALLTPEALTW